jgi:hypothetical protein
VQTLDRKDAKRDAKGRRLLSKIPAVLFGCGRPFFYDLCDLAGAQFYAVRRQISRSLERLTISNPGRDRTAADYNQLAQNSKELAAPSRPQGRQSHT